MQVSYNGFTGELVKFEKKGEGIAVLNWVQGMPKTVDCKYDISIYDSEKQVTHSFTSVNLKDVKFLGGTVSFGG